eukprot:1146809-Pelagomonas_calceolata.AAC.14
MCLDEAGWGGVVGRMDTRCLAQRAASVEYVSRSFGVWKGSVVSFGMMAPLFGLPLHLHCVRPFGRLLLCMSIHVLGDQVGSKLYHVFPCSTSVSNISNSALKSETLHQTCIHLLARSALICGDYCGKHEGLLHEYASTGWDLLF